ncbi:energy transducer TonB [Pseudomonas sp. LRF_L74]|uniref:energy transducer TonB n=1 Tax=Pseudomonas sp. LRF_L74 TaxID=3369422 RepID=UPI003F5E4205
MNSLTFQQQEPRGNAANWREHGLALGMAAALHLGLGVVLFNLSSGTPMAPAVAAVIKTQLLSLPAPVQQPALATPVEPAPAPAPAPVTKAAKVEQADLAFKRVEQQRQQQARRIERERQQRLRDEQVRHEREQQRQAQQEQQRLAAAQRAENQRQAAADAEAQAAASRQYLPIAKEAPDYPARALDRRIEGECTVAYTVNAQGRVENPQVVGNCHPLFVKPSLAAARTFRYQPRVVDGQAVAVANVKNTFTYRIQ